MACLKLKAGILKTVVLETVPPGCMGHESRESCGVRAVCMRCAWCASRGCCGVHAVCVWCASRVCCGVCAVCTRCACGVHPEGAV
eukprot:scaffold131720_cov24-Tisochrysis_lutea.AAC.2